MHSLWYFDTIWSEFRYTNGAVERIQCTINSDVFREIPSYTVRELKITLSRLRAAFIVMNKKMCSIIVESEQYIKFLRYIRELRKVASDIEDVLDVVAADDMLLLLESNSQPCDLSSRLSDLSQSLAQILAHIIVVSDSQIRIPDDMYEAVFKEVTPSAYQLHSSKPTASSSFTCSENVLLLWEDVVIGRESTTQQIVNTIFSSTKRKHPIIVTLTGIPGIGKTTLAKLVCDHKFIKLPSGFDLILSVSCRNGLDSAIFEIIRSVIPRCQYMPTELLIETLRGILQGKMYLLVLDDFRLRYCRADWALLMEILEVGLRGSTVILITDSCSSSKEATRSRTFELRGLPEDACWCLFSRYAVFDEDSEQVYPSLYQIGRSIVNKCAGCPLAIKTMGSTLRACRDELEWKKINDNKLWDLEKDVASVALRINITRMPNELVQCFVYSAILLEDKLVSRDQLVYFWLAQGLLQSKKGNDDLRYIGDMYCNELLSRGFLQLHNSDWPHHEILKMHDQVHDLVKPLILGERSIVGGEFVNMIPHVIWDRDQVSSDGEFCWNNLNKARTFLFRNYIGPVKNQFLERLISSLSCARVILLDHSEFEELPDVIGNLKQLRYLSLAGNHKLQILPESLCKIVNLQTLDVSGCEQLTSLPKGMKKLETLRHLHLSMKLTTLPEELLYCLTSLDLFRICNSQYLESIFKGIENLTALRVLLIHDCPSIASLPSSIKCLTNLREFSILNCETLELTGWDGLQGLIALEFLHFQGLPKLCNFPDGLQSASGSLQRLVVISCENLEALPDCLQESNNLLEMVIQSCPSILSLPADFDAVRTLQKIKILNCPKLVARCEREQGLDWHLIAHIPSVQLDHQVIQNKAASTCKQHQGVSPADSPSSSFLRPVSDLSTVSSPYGINTNVKEVWNEERRAKSKRRFLGTWLWGKLLNKMQTKAAKQTRRILRSCWDDVSVKVEEMVIVRVYLQEHQDLQEHQQKESSPEMAIDLSKERDNGNGHPMVRPWHQWFWPLKRWRRRSREGFMEFQQPPSVTETKIIQCPTPPPPPPVPSPSIRRVIKIPASEIQAREGFMEFQQPPSVTETKIIQCPTPLPPPPVPSPSIRRVIKILASEIQAREGFMEFQQPPSVTETKIIQCPTPPPPPPVPSPSIRRVIKIPASEIQGTAEIVRVYLQEHQDLQEHQQKESSPEMAIDLSKERDNGNGHPMVRPWHQWFWPLKRWRRRSREGFMEFQQPPSVTETKIIQCPTPPPPPPVPSPSIRRVIKIPASEIQAREGFMEFQQPPSVTETKIIQCPTPLPPPPVPSPSIRRVIKILASEIQAREGFMEFQQPPSVTETKIIQCPTPPPPPPVPSPSIRRVIKIPASEIQAREGFMEFQQPTSVTETKIIQCPTPPPPPPVPSPSIRRVIKIPASEIQAREGFMEFQQPPSVTETKIIQCPTPPPPPPVPSPSIRRVIKIPASEIQAREGFMEFQQPPSVTETKIIQCPTPPPPPPVPSPSIRRVIKIPASEIQAREGFMEFQQPPSVTETKIIQCPTPPPPPPVPSPSIRRVIKIPASEIQAREGLMEFQQPPSVTETKIIQCPTPPPPPPVPSPSIRRVIKIPASEIQAREGFMEFQQPPSVTETKIIQCPTPPPPPPVPSPSIRRVIKIPASEIQAREGFMEFQQPPSVTETKIIQCLTPPPPPPVPSPSIRRVIKIPASEIQAREGLMEFQQPPSVTETKIIQCPTPPPPPPVPSPSIRRVIKIPASEIQAREGFMEFQQPPPSVTETKIIQCPTPPPPPPVPSPSIRRVIKIPASEIQAREGFMEFQQPPPSVTETKIIQCPTPPPPPVPSPSIRRVIKIPASEIQVETEAEDKISLIGDMQHKNVPDSDFKNFSKGILLLLGSGYEFDKDKLIQFWMAASEPMEMDYAAYFKKLESEEYILRSDADLLYRVNNEKVSMDDSILKTEYLILDRKCQIEAATADILHVSVLDDDMDDSILKALKKFKWLRTLLFNGYHSSRLQKMLLELFLNCESLVVLDLSGTDIKELPSSTGKMTQLRYLDLSWTLIELLPEAICRFEGLQTLRLKGCSNLWRLPRDFKRLTKLRHLDFDVLGNLAVMPEGIGALVNLRALSAFLVGTQEGCNITELKELKNLIGELCIAMLENVQSVDDAKVASLKDKEHLKKLELRWTDATFQETENEGINNGVLESLCPHSDLEELHIQFYCGTELPKWIADEAFHKLSSITLFRCDHVYVLPSIQKLPSLEYLRLFGLVSVTELDFGCETEGGTAFPKLQTIIIDKLFKLKIWKEEKEGDFPCLVGLTIKDCPELSQLPSLVYRTSTSLKFVMVEDCPLIKKSRLENEDQFLGKLKHIQNVWIDQDDDSDLLDDDESKYSSDDTEVVDEVVTKQNGFSTEAIYYPTK